MDNLQELLEELGITESEYNQFRKNIKMLPLLFCDKKIYLLSWVSLN